MTDVTVEDWEALFRLATQYKCRYWRDGTQNSIPKVAEIFSERVGTHLLTIEIGRVKVNCHFFTPEEIELDIDPREVRDSTDHNEVLQFLEALANATLKTACICEENTPDILYLSYNPISQAWAIHDIQLGNQ